MDIFTNLNTTY